ncbi:MAG: hydroxylamine reductase [Bacteroidales bacterium]|nr:MAG: hydroxylamine reductase [Bacteroidales bacterium]
MSMFCYQCQETSKGTGCTVMGVCGKSAEVSNLQDLLVYLLKGISVYSTEARKKGVEDEQINKFVFDGLFKTITNANFDKSVFENVIREAFEVREKAKSLMEKVGATTTCQHDSAVWRCKTTEEMEKKATQIGILTIENEDVRSLRELVIYGLKGMAAYAEHAYNLGQQSNEIWEYMQRALVATIDDSLSVEQLIDIVLECGKYGVVAMDLLDKTNTTKYGSPEMTKVNIGVKNNPAILISGHDLRDMEDLLEQTKGTGVDVYTHSEMLPAHYYPKFKQYEHFVGNYGNAWWKQKEEFETFNGPILFTTNCIVPPTSSASYKDRIYTTGASGLTGAKHIADRPQGGSKDFSAIIEHAKNCQPPTQIEQGEILGGFAHAQVFALADKVVEAVKSGAIRKFVVMAGCDGRMKDRNYYTEFAQKLPQDVVILTAGCAKYRYNKLPLGDINGIPRLLDAGQCNDSYSLAVIALKLKEIFNLNDVNELPIAYNIAWYEQKAVIVLLALLYLGVKNIHLGPTLPAFLSPNVAKVLVENFGIGGISTVDEDIATLINA